MNCETAQEHFSDYITQDLERAMALSVENHLQSCERCRAEVASLRLTWDSLGQMPRVELPLYFHENLMARLAAEQGKEEETAARRAVWDWRSLFRPRALAYAAAGLILLLTLTQVVPGVRAVIDPISWIVRIFKPAPVNPAPAVSAVWTPAPQDNLAANGTLTVRLTPVQGTSNAGVKYMLAVPGDPNPKSGVLAPTRETVETFSLPNAPASVSLTVGDETTQKTIPVTTTGANP